jgi:hypothetical protein
MPWSWMYIYGLIPFFLCFGFHCKISIVRVRMTLTGGRRFFFSSSFFFSQTKFTFSLLFFPSLSFVLLQWRYVYVCVKKIIKKEIRSTSGVITIFQFSLSSFRQISICI